jgi:hypothetical protein
VTRTAGTVVRVGIGGLILLSSLRLAQYFVLRDHVRRALLWILIDMVAWLLGITWTLLPSPWVDQSTPIGALIVIYGVAGRCVAAMVALITGWKPIAEDQPPFNPLDPTLTTCVCTSGLWSMRTDARVQKMQHVSGVLKVGDLRGLVLAVGHRRQMSMMGLAPSAGTEVESMCSTSSAVCPAETGCTRPRGRTRDELLLGLA